MPAAARILPRLLSEDANTYAGADLANAVRLVAVMTALNGLLAALYFAFDPPTASLGGAGWTIAWALVIASFAIAARLLRHPPRRGFVALLALSYAGLAGVALLDWLAGGAETPYNRLYLFWLISAVGVHPPRRALTFLGATVAFASLPLVYGGWNSSEASYIATSLLLWAAIAALTILLMTYVRTQREELRADEERAQRLARADSLTGLGNRRAFDEALVTEVARVRRVESTVTVALIDVDDFKDLNDRYGHLEGDRCLKGVAEAIRDSIRGGDRAFRWGGDEIALIFPDTDHDGAVESLERIVARIRDSVHGPEGDGLGVSWGAAEFEPAITAGDLLARADLALMAAKHRGGRSHVQPAA